MTLWMLWTIAVAVTVGASCVVIERALSTRGRPGRWVWLSALGAVFGLSGWAALRPTRAFVVSDLPVSASSGAPSMAASGGVDRWAWLRAGFESALGWADVVAPWVWVVWTGVALLALGAGLFVLRRRAGRWVRAELDGEEVALSEDFGPALVGVWRPTIVLPRWILALHPRERRLALRHEVEHRDARDTILLSIGALAAAVMPWNPAVWFISKRLRQAVEVDCDRRVLESGTSPAEYGSLLIELSAASPRSGLSVAAMTQPASLLERRLTMMTKKTKGSSLFGATGAFLVAALVLVAACDTPPPSMTAPETDAALEGAAAVVAEPLGGLVSAEGAPLIYIDGIRVERSEGADVLGSLDPDEIDRIEIVKGAAAIANFGEEATSGVVQIFLKTEPGNEPVTLREMEPTGDAGESGVLYEIREPGGERVFETGREIALGSDVRLRQPATLSAAKLFVDGKQVSSIDDIRPEDVERMDVVGGEEGDEIHVILKSSARSGGS